MTEQRAQMDPDTHIALAERLLVDRADTASALAHAAIASAMAARDAVLMASQATTTIVPSTVEEARGWASSRLDSLEWGVRYEHGGVTYTVRFGTDRAPAEDHVRRGNLLEGVGHRLVVRHVTGWEEA